MKRLQKHRPGKQNRRWNLEKLEDRRLMIASAIAPIDVVDTTDFYGPIQIAPVTAGATNVAARTGSNDRVARIVDGTRTSDYAAVGVVGDQANGPGCTGTLISPTHVLTAAHCSVTDRGRPISDTSGTFTVGGRTYQTERVFVHPGYDNNSLANDIAIFQLREPVVGITPEQISRSAPTVGQQLTLVGFGAGGTGASGHTGDFGTKRVGQTPIDRVTATEIQWTFAPGESNTAPGDSGGPAFVTVGGVRYLAGVTSYGENDNAGYGDQSGDTRVDAFASWIDSIVGLQVIDPVDPVDPIDPIDPVDPLDPNRDDHGDRLADATPIDLGSGERASLDAILEVEGDRDFFSFDLAEASEVSLALSSNGSDVDTYLRLYDATGNLIGENDDTGRSLDSALATRLAAGRYYFSAGGYNDGEEGNYRVEAQATVSQTSDGGGDVDIDLDERGRGQIESQLIAGQTTTLTFEAVGSGRTTINASAQSRGVDTVMRVLDSSGNVVAMNDDYGRGLNSRVDFQAVAGEVYSVEVSEYSGDAGDFRLTINNRTSRSVSQRVSRGAANDEAICGFVYGPVLDMDWV
ncbi:Trypsin [Rubripirellula tenax]|uniref:Trypsin n=1 Tax=Rubripirellula tenax TaxID=2528015 RepID=A0A5C6F6H4_9BACT|nr:DVUA0089 family protein [Rubripirellula tenax]TWU56968.1 Trypsin [Rubripirellula tenax]